MLNENFQISLEKASFKWKISKENVLHDITLKIKENQSILIYGG